MALGRIAVAAVLTFIGAFAHATQVPSTQAAWNLDFPDPSILKASDGYYYAYATQTISETTKAPLLMNIQVARTKDLKNWTHLGDALPTKPTWAHTTQKFWAPHVNAHNGKYYMYFSAEPDAQNGLCLAVAVATQPQGPFTDIGQPLQCGNGFENIDPMLFEDPQTKKALLYWGSGFGPIKVQELAQDRISFAKNSTPQPLVYPQPNSPAEKYMRLVEGAWMEYKNGNYFLFFSGDNCCDTPHYAVMVAKAKTPFGPFQLLESVSKTSSVILDESSKFIGPGHNSVITDENNKSWILYHAVDITQPQLRFPIPGDRSVRRVLMIDRLCWPKTQSDWPSISTDGDCH